MYPCDLCQVGLITADILTMTKYLHYVMQVIACAFGTEAMLLRLRICFSFLFGYVMCTYSLKAQQGGMSLVLQNQGSFVTLTRQNTAHFHLFVDSGTKNGGDKKGEDRITCKSESVS